MTWMRIESEGPRGGHIIKLRKPDPEALAIARPLIEQAIQDAVADTGKPREWVIDVMTALTVERKADHDAYQRECERRGLLPL